MRDLPVARVDLRRDEVGPAEARVRQRRAPALAQRPQRVGDDPRLLDRVDGAALLPVAAASTSACPARPCTVISGRSEPRADVQIWKPVGSGTIAAVARAPRSADASVPAPDVSSSVTTLTSRSPASRTPRPASTSHAITAQATPPFMSQAPRP